MAARRLRLSGLAAAAHRAFRRHLVPDPEAFLERHQQARPPHVHVGGHRRHADLHALPAGGHVQRRLQRRGGGAERGAVQGPRSLVAFAVPVRVGRWGGGPEPDMIESAHRLCNLNGGPSVELSRAADFFEAAMAEAHDLTTWVGELYFELHRGTYTSQ